MFDEQEIEKFPKVQINNINEKMTRFDIDQRFAKYGKILGINMQANYIQVVYDNEDSVHQAVRHEHLTQLREKRIEVVACIDKGMNRLGNNNMGRGRGSGRGMPVGRGDQFRGSEPKGRFDDNFGRGGPMGMNSGRGDSEPFPKQSRFEPPREPLAPPRPPESFNNYMPDPFMGPAKVNDCEILVMNKLQQVYAELIEQRLKNIGLSVDLMFMRDELAVMRALNEMAKKGTFYAVVITPENEIRGSLTLNILQGSKPQEHRNMPMDDALKMVARTFAQMRQEKRGLGATTPIDREIHFILNLLMNGKYLTIPELDRVLNYVQDLRDRQAIAENIPLSSNRPVTTTSADNLSKPAETTPAVDPMVEQQNLQQRILNIISNQNAPPLPQTSSTGLSLTSTMSTVTRSPVGTTMSQATTSQPPTTPNTYINFDNPSVQKALDSLMSSGPNLLKSISMVSGNNNTGSSSNSTHNNSMMPNRMNPSGTQNNFNGMSQTGTGSAVQGPNSLNSANAFQTGQNMMGGTQPTQNQGYRHPLMGTQIGTTGQGQFFNQRGGSGMRY